MSFARLLAALIILAQLFGFTACSAKPLSPAATTTVTVTNLPKPSFTPTDTLTPTQTATPSQTPTRTRTPTITTTPIGSYFHYDAGFSVTFPAYWKVVQSGRNSLLIGQPNNSLYVLIDSRAEKESQSMDKIITRLKGELRAQSVMIGKARPVDLPDQVTAQVVDVTAVYGQDDQDWRILYTHQANRGYTLVEIAKRGGVEKEEAVLDAIIQSLHLFAPQPFGLAHDQTLVLAGGDPSPKDLDPAITTSSAATYVGLLYSGLVQLNAQLQIIPNLAEKWTVSPDGRVYKFTLKPGLKFANDNPLKAIDVKNSWERACDPATGSTTAATYLGDIQGVKDKLGKQADSISGLKVIDDTTLQVTLTAPITYFLAKLTSPTAAVLDVTSTLSGANKWMYSPNPSGPYQIKEYKKDEDILFERNPNYPQPPNIPYLAFIFGGGTSIDLYDEGTVDLTGISGSDVTRVSNPSDPLNKELHSIPSLCTSFLQLDPSRPPLDDINVRRALALATDKAAFIQQQTDNTALVANSILPPAMPGYLAGRRLPGFDPAAATAALAASKYGKNMPPVILAASGYGDAKRKDVAEIVDMWQKILGITVQVQYLDPLNFTSAARDNPAHAVLYSWCADYPDPQNFLDLLFHSQSDFNVGHMSKPDFDKLVEQARLEKDVNQRLVLYQKAEQMLLDDVDTIPLLHPVFYALVKPRVKGYIMTPIGVNQYPGLTLENPLQP
jgi:ABC-type transport system substrate-binding protein